MMSDPRPKPDSAGTRRKQRGARDERDGQRSGEGRTGAKRLAGWQKALLAGSIVVMLVGAGLAAYGAIAGGDEPAPTTGGGPAAALGPSGFMPVEGGGGAPSGEAAATEGGSLHDFSPAIFRLGFSFFVGFCIAYAVRTFVKISVISIGVILLALFGLQYAGVISVDWSAMGGHYDSALGWLREQTGSFTQFVKGSLPSAGMAAFGLVVGFKKR